MRSFGRRAMFSGRTVEESGVSIFNETEVNKRIGVDLHILEKFKGTKSEGPRAICIQIRCMNIRTLTTCIGTHWVLSVQETQLGPSDVC